MAVVLFVVKGDRTSMYLHSEWVGGANGSARFFNDYCNWTRIKEYKEYVEHSPAAELSRRLLRSPEAIFYHEHVLMKEPGTTVKTPWHHDQPYYPING